MLPIKNTYGRKNFVNLLTAKKTVRDFLLGVYGSSCDLHIVDAYPGPGIFSQALHEELKPKKHLLMEPHIAYQKYLEDREWTKRPGVFLTKADPFRWSAFTDLRAEHDLPKDMSRTGIHKNLLYTANLTSTQGEQLCTQYLNCITNQSWLESLGRVKLLLWVREATAIKVLATKGDKHRSRVSVQRESASEGRLLLKKDDYGKKDFFPGREPYPVLLELDPIEKQVEHLDSFEYVIKMLFVLKNKPLREVLNVLGPGALEDVGSKLPEGYLDAKPCEMGLLEFEVIAKEFDRWPFKPSFLHDFYEEDGVGVM